MLKIEKPKKKFQESWSWFEVEANGTAPCARSLHACVAFENNIYIFGGYDGVNRRHDFYKYNVETNAWS